LRVLRKLNGALIVCEDDLRFQGFLLHFRRLNA
jgi:hypothetical protein